MWQGILFHTVLAIFIASRSVAKIAGQVNANVILGHYGQAVRGADSAAEALERAFGA